MGITVLNEVKKQSKDGDYLCLQHVIYPYENQNNKEGYRFIWKTSDGKMQPSRGQARIPSLSIALELISLALSEGWGIITFDLYTRILD